MHDKELIAKLFRQEFSKMVAVISRSFGLQHLETAEDIVSETFLTAEENWKVSGVPANPVAWLYAVAKQKTLYHLRRGKIYENKVLPALVKTAEVDAVEEPDFSGTGILDSQLQMMFAVCHPAIASEAQMALALRILCGFGIDEIASAFLTNKETINKRLHRAKERLRTEGIRLELPSDKEMDERLKTVLHIIYLLFNEGYYSTTHNNILRQELCHEALHLGLLLTQFNRTAQPEVYALLALICFHASRLEARNANDTYPVLYEQQDERLWNRELIEKGEYFLDLAAQGIKLTSYHLEAGIAFWHSKKEDTAEKWEAILEHYNLLLQLNYSPIAVLNKTYALYKARGKETALQEALNLGLTNNHFYHVLLAELYGNTEAEKAKEHFRLAHSLAVTAPEKEFIKQKMNAVISKP